MKISIITISYNSALTIGETLNSIKNQIQNNIEHIIIDGNSTDNTLKICNQFPHISKIISEPDKGVYDAFNKGLRLATGDVVGFLNSDDIFYDNYSLQTIAASFDDQIDCIFGNLDYINTEGKIARKWRSKPYRKGDFSKGWMPAHPTFYCRKPIYDQLGGYDDSFDIAGDFELMLRFLEKNNIRSKYIDKTLVKMMEGGLSNNGISSKIKIIKEEKRALQQNKIDFSFFKYFLNKAKKIKEFF
tara:strand:- start:82 stop:813 length:732 start_codon:yes stop_codon:yes gene_type:complete